MYPKCFKSTQNSESIPVQWMSRKQDITEAYLARNLSLVLFIVYGCCFFGRVAEDGLCPGSFKFVNSVRVLLH